MSSTSPGGKLRAGAIVFGWLADILSSNVLGIPVILAFGGDPTDVDSYSRVVASDAFVLANLPIGLLGTAIGGFVGAHLARGEELNNAFVVGVASAVTSLVFSIGAPVPLWAVAASVILTVPAALAGGYLRARTRK